MTKQQLEQEIEEARSPAYRKILIEADPQFEKVKGWKKALVLRLAEQLDKDGKVEKQMICSTIIHDLSKRISEGEISADRVWDNLPSRFKKPEMQKGRLGSHNENHTKQLAKVVEQWTDLKMENIHGKMSGQELITESKEYRQRLVIPWTDQKVYITEEVLIMLVPLLKDTLVLMSEEARGRRAKSKLITR